MRMKALLLALLLISVPVASLSQTKRRHPAKKQFPINPRIGPSGELSWEYKSWRKNKRASCRVAMRKDYLYPSLLDRIEKLIELAFSTGAARKIDELDMDHVHPLFEKQKEKGGRWSGGTLYIDLQNPDAILLHTQEYVHYEPRFFEKRNIFSRRGGVPEILPCKVKYDEPSAQSPGRAHCTVFPDDLRMQEASPTMILFVRVDNIPKALLLPYTRNIRIIRGQKILFAMPNNACGGYGGN